LSRGDLTEVEWRILKALLPVEREPGKRGVGRPPEDATSSTACCGCCAPVRRGAMCPRNTATGTRSIGAFGAGAPAVSGRAWRSLSPRRWPREREHYNIDSTTVRAHVSAAGGKGGSSTSFCPLADGFTNKVHPGDARGRPIAFHLTSAEAAECNVYDTLIDLPEQAPDALLADKAYDTDAIRYDLKQRGIKPVIPPKSKRAATTTAQSPRDMISSPRASSACYLWLSSLLDQICPRRLTHGFKMNELLSFLFV
jgi:transposase